MDAYKEIRQAQKDWARSKGIPFDSRGYVWNVEANLREPLSVHARQGFEKGAGSELNGHMRALHSSSVLVANFFDYWTERDKIPLLSALGMDSVGGQTLDFESQFPTVLEGTPPHLDLVEGYPVRPEESHASGHRIFPILANFGPRSTYPNAKHLPRNSGPKNSVVAGSDSSTWTRANSSSTRSVWLLNWARVLASTICTMTGPGIGQRRTGGKSTSLRRGWETRLDSGH